jgi:hypothetical protein
MEAQLGRLVAPRFFAPPHDVSAGSLIGEALTPLHRAAPDPVIVPVAHPSRSAGAGVVGGTHAYLVLAEVLSGSADSELADSIDLAIASVLSLMPLMADVIRTIGDKNWEPVLSVFLLVCLLLFALVIWQIAIVAATPQVPRSLTTQ